MATSGGTAHQALALAWAKHEQEVRAVQLGKAKHANVDVLYVATQVEAIAARLLPLRERLPLALPHVRATWLDDLATLSRAAMWTALAVNTTSKGTGDAGTLITRAAALRGRLAIALRGILAFAPQPAVHQVPKMVGRAPAHHAAALQGLVTALRDEGFETTPERAADLAAADRLVLELMTASRAREVSAELAEARELRAKALMLLRVTYEEIRAAVLWLAREEPGVGALVPKLWNMRKKGTARARKRVPRAPTAEGTGVAGRGDGLDGELGARDLDGAHQ